MSSLLEFASSQEEIEGGGGGETEQLDLVPAKRILLPRETFLGAAVSLKDQVGSFFYFLPFCSNSFSCSVVDLLLCPNCLFGAVRAWIC